MFDLHNRRVPIFNMWKTKHCIEALKYTDSLAHAIISFSILIYVLQKRWKERMKKNTRS